MKPPKFEVVKFIALGCFSAIYEVVYPEADDKVSTTKFALKRFYLQNSFAVSCALREQAVLVRLAQAEQQSPFFCTLFQSIRLRGGPALVLRKGSGYNLRDITLNFGYLKESKLRFYCCELVCALEYLHAMDIVHLDIKPANTLLDDSGHILITDFDRAYDMTRKTGPLTKGDFTGTPFYKAPEVRDWIEITGKADVWSMGIVIATMVYKRSLIRNWLRKDQITDDDLPSGSMPLRHFFKACLTADPDKRVTISDVKRLKFYKGVNWEQVKTCAISPPYHPSQLKIFPARVVYKVDPQDSLLLAAAYRKCMPKRGSHLRDYYDKHGVRRLMEVPTDRKDILSAGMTARKMDELFADFEFTSPLLLASCHGADGNRDVSGDRGASHKGKQSELEHVP